VSVDLRERLRRALGPSDPRQTPPPPARPTLPRRDRDVHDLVPGRVLEGPAGRCFLAERAFDLGHVHGGATLGAFLGLAERAVACLARDAAAPSLDLREVVFLDTETTGLSGGTGTYVFMVGLGFFDGDQFVVRQYFMRHHAEEPAMLTELNRLLPRFRAVVSFNGKAFDLPLLETRFVAGRQRSAWRVDSHLDLLFPARRVWRDRIESCSLGSLERAVLGHARRLDVPSWAIPELYFRYVRGGDARPMTRVFAHNLDDVLSLVALACRLGRLMADPLAGVADAEDLFAVARLYEDLGYWDDACACYERALDGCRSGEQRGRVASRLAALCKRTGRAERAVELWRRSAAAGEAACQPYVELAKYYEHRARDYARAIAVVEQALTVLELRATQRPFATPTIERAELERRLARLLAKQRRSGFTAAGGSRRAPE
jgi:uncharacterized protein